MNIKKNLKTIVIFSIFFLVSFPIIFNISKYRIDTYNKKEIFDSFKIVVTLKYDNLFRKFGLVNQHIESLNQEYFYFYEENIRVLRPNNTDSIIENSPITENFTIILNESDIFFQVPYSAMKGIFKLNEVVNNLAFSNNPLCSKIIKIRSDEILIDNFNFNIVVQMRQFTNDSQNSLTEVFINCFEDVIRVKTKILVDYLKNFHSMSYSDNQILLDSYINNKSGLFCDKINEDIVREKLEQVPDLIFNDLEKDFFKIKYTGPYDISSINTYERDFSIYFVSFILTLLVNILFFLCLFLLKRKINFLKKIF